MRTIREDTPNRGTLFFVETTNEENGKDFAQRHGPFFSLEEARQFRIDAGESMTETEKTELALRRAWYKTKANNPPTIQEFVEAFIASLTDINTGKATDDRDALETERE